MMLRNPHFAKKQISQLVQNQMLNGRFLQNADLNSSDDDGENPHIRQSHLEDLDQFSDTSDQEIKMPRGNQSQNNLHKVKRGLKDCKGESGLFNPMKAFNCLNDM